MEFTHNRLWRWIGLWNVVATVLLVGTGSGMTADASSKSPTASQVQRVIDAHFAHKRKYQQDDLISQSDARAVIAELKKNGWAVPRSKTLLAKLLPESDALVQLLASEKGKRFMRAVSGKRLIYDRLDRIMRESGGSALLRQLVRLPDGARYAAWKPPRAVPDLVALLPKKGNGKKRVVKDYRKPTGRIYTQQQLAATLVKLFHPPR